jgi:HD-like signal output (HDOD) protein
MIPVGLEGKVPRKGNIMDLPPIEIDPKTFLKEHFILPPLPEVVTNLMDAINSGKTTAKEIAGLVKSDAGLVAQVLKVVNSAYYGLPRHISDVTHAVAYLGFGEIYRIVLTVSVTKALEPPMPDVFRRYWSHSYFTAIISKQLVSSYEKTLDPGDIYTAAVLHDIGKLVYIRFFPDHYQAMASYCEREQTFLADAEERFGLPSHLMFGSILCDRWQLPDDLKEACENHELAWLESLEPGSGEGQATRVIAIANLLANLAEESLEESLKVRVSEAVKKSLDLTDDDFLLLMADVYEMKAEVARFLNSV